MCECYKGTNELRYCNNHREMSGGSVSSSNLEKVVGASYSTSSNNPNKEEGY